MNNRAGQDSISPTNTGAGASQAGVVQKEGENLERFCNEGGVRQVFHAKPERVFTWAAVKWRTKLSQAGTTPKNLHFGKYSSSEKK